MIYVGIDDTDVIGSPGTNQLARAIVSRLAAAAREAIVCRHQLFVDSRIPYTSQNGSASIQLPYGDAVPRAVLLATVRDVMRDRYVEGSDPGLAVCEQVTEPMASFAERATREVLSQAEARAVAAGSHCHLEGLGGTQQGIIGALAAVALAAGGANGRVVHVEGWPWPDPLAGVQAASVIRARGVAEIRTRAGQRFTGEQVDVGRHLRPNWCGGQIVLFVEPPADGRQVWRALKLA